MSFVGYRFNALLGAPFKGGSVLLQDDVLIAPVGNRINVVELGRSSVYTLPVESSYPIQALALSPLGHLLVAVNSAGQAVLVNFPRRVVLHHFSFKGESHVAPRAVSFSPCGEYLAVGADRKLQLWHLPVKGTSAKSFAPLRLMRSHVGFSESITCVCWSADSEFLAAGSQDLTVRIYSLENRRGVKAARLTGHKEAVVAVEFAQVGESKPVLYSVAADGALFVWEQEEDIHDPEKESNDDEENDVLGEEEGDEETDHRHTKLATKAKGSDAQEVRPSRISRQGKWTLKAKHLFGQSYAQVTSAQVSVSGTLFAAGFSSGLFGIWTLPDFTQVHLLSVSRAAINALTFNARGDWLALGCSSLGQLLVWEWRSETYVMKQQGHAHDINAVAYSPDDQLMVTGADDAKLKVWNSSSGYCFVTFTEHTQPITAVAFSPVGHAVLSASLDGTVRAFDLVRYRNFRTFTAPTPAQFTSLAIDNSGEVVCAGSSDTLHVYVWSLRTGRLLSAAAGHEGPVSSVLFNPSRPLVASASWDRSVRLWDIFGGKGQVEKLEHSHDVLALAFRPDGKQLCSSTMGGQLLMWDVDSGEQRGFIEGRRDIIGGRRATDRRAVEGMSSRNNFTSLCYSADGIYLLACGTCKYVCLYDAQERVLLRRFQISRNRALDGVLDKLNSKQMTEAGPVELIMDEDDNDDMQSASALPGTASAVQRKPALQGKCVSLAPTGRQFAVATTEGLLIYSIDAAVEYDPVELDLDVTPQSVVRALQEDRYGPALTLALRLNEQELIQGVLDAVPPDQIVTISTALSLTYAVRLLGALVKYMDTTSNCEFALRWCQAVLASHGRNLRSGSTQRRTAGSVLSAATAAVPLLRAVMQKVSQLEESLGNACQENVHTLAYLTSLAAKAQKGGELVEIAGTGNKERLHRALNGESAGTVLPNGRDVVVDKLAAEDLAPPKKKAKKTRGKKTG